MTLLAVLLGALSLIISGYAAKIAKKSDKKMTAIADSQIDEKLAMMAGYLSITRHVKRNIDELGLGDPAYVSLNDIRRIKSDFNAVSDLREYVIPEKKEQLIVIYIIPILEDLYYIKNTYLQHNWQKSPENVVLSEEWDEVFKDIAKKTLTYNIEKEKIEKLIND